MVDIARMQDALGKMLVDGWLLGDFRGNNPLARRILQLDKRPLGTRRLFYCVPALGEPKKLVHRIEAAALDHLPGERIIYLSWQEFESGLQALVQGMQRVAMEYSPRNAIPYVARMDAGTVELVRSFGVDVVSSGDLIQLFEATWDEEQWEMHLRAAERTDQAFRHAGQCSAHEVRRQTAIRETDVQRVILEFFANHGLITDHGPIVAAGAHSGDPHFDTCPENDALIREGDLVLIDLWAKLNRPRAVYSDLTRMGVVDTRVDERYASLFAVVAQARDAAVQRVREAFGCGRAIRGWEVDAAARQVIEAAGYGRAFIHRTGHSIGQETHGNGANMDNLEMRDERTVLPRTCFSVEPGVYLPEYGVRSEVNVFVDGDRCVHVTGGEPQQRVTAILAEF